MMGVAPTCYVYTIHEQNTRLLPKTESDFQFLAGFGFDTAAFGYIQRQQMGDQRIHADSLRIRFGLQAVIQMHRYPQLRSHDSGSTPIWFQREDRFAQLIRFHLRIDVQHIIDLGVTDDLGDRLGGNFLFAKAGHKGVTAHMAG